MRETAHALWRRRVMWFSGEFLVVVAGILAALSVNGWYEGRKRTADEYTYLIQLIADLREAEASIQAGTIMQRREMPPRS